MTNDPPEAVVKAASEAIKSVLGPYLAISPTPRFDALVNQAARADGRLQKAIAIDYGVHSSYISMLKKNIRRVK